MAVHAAYTIAVVASPLCEMPALFGKTDRTVIGAIFVPPLVQSIVPQELQLIELAEKLALLPAERIQAVPEGKIHRRSQFIHVLPHISIIVRSPTNKFVGLRSLLCLPQIILIEVMSFFSRLA